MTTETLPDQNEVTFDQFRAEWLQEFTEREMAPLEKGRHFAFKMITQWLEVNEDDEDLVLCDGSGDGGIDIAYLRRAEVEVSNDVEQDGQSVDGDIWYLFQSKYGSAFQGQETVFNEGRKVINTLAGENNSLSQDARQLLGRLDIFRQQASERDRIVLVFATDSAMSESDRQALNDLRALGKARLGGLFDVEDVSLNTIWEKTRETALQPTLSLPIRGNFVDPSSGLRVGTVSLIDLYEFLKGYRTKTGNLDQLYERNVRQFLGGRRKINKGIAQTLEKKPEIFGLYNNGITIVVSDFSTSKGDDSCLLFDPYVVNGCQTTKTIWEELSQRLESGGTGHNATVSDWRARAERGVVVTKIVKSDSASINDITRYTNSQNAVREQDFLALRKDFAGWKTDMDSRYDIFLEIQRGGWDSQRAYQKSHPTSKQFTEYGNAFDLIKVYGAGWFGEPGSAFGRSAPFLPGGSVFRRLTETEPIGADDLYAAYKLQKLSARFGFGRGANVKPSRRQTRFLYYFVVIELLKDVLIRGGHTYSSRGLTEAFLALLEVENEDTLELLLDAGIEVVDEYLSRESDDSVFEESNFEGDLNAWFKLEALGKGTDRTYRLNSLLQAHKAIFGRGIKGQSSPRILVNNAIISDRP
ncbi:MAG: AIPR family protein [Caldilineaceae bacterium SB0661_bin_32]|uniref:AIPR family protein n=1 Tax=Caldilineaceae bacterium SB0661_bin_32 TaxID=2605255 RepID=A0A6B1DBZ5_9CHLR|nr:AIPR family protein [Caldilineaceae bacterium SB0661_bin_32]